MIRKISFGLAVATVLGCGPAMENGSNLALKTMTKAQALEDFDAIVGQFKALYGPLEYKQRRFKYSLDQLVTDARVELENTKSDAEVYAVYKKFLGRFEDGHVSIRFTGNSDDVDAFGLPFFLTPVEDHALVGDVSAEGKDLGIALGDELVKIDGVTPFELLERIKIYSAIGNDESDKHLISQVVTRPYYLAELAPKKPTASLEFTRANGTQYSVEAVWTKVKPATAKKIDPVFNVSDFDMRAPYAEDHNQLAGTRLAMGARDPFFVSEQVKSSYGLVEVSPNADYLKKYGLTAKEVTIDDKFVFYAAIYKFEGKTILLVRNDGYVPKIPADKMIAAYQALLDQYDDFVDVLVVDQNHNPGGSLEYANDFFALFVKGTANNLVQEMHADRRWVFDLRQWADELEKQKRSGYAKALRLRAELIDRAINEGKQLTAPMPLLGFEAIEANAKYSWQKPVLVLADELAGSCGDIFPMYMQRNGRAKIFGNRTMGLGGNVEEVIQLPHSQASVRLTRGLFTTYRKDGVYTDEDKVENNGIKPDFPHKITVSDFRAGYIDYVKQFSTKALEISKS